MRLVQVEGTWSLPVSGAGRLKALIDRVYERMDALPHRRREGGPER
nr:hypothetical protein GCM10020093_112410 [Planobispora longispora]